LEGWQSAKISVDFINTLLSPTDGVVYFRLKLHFPTVPKKDKSENFDRNTDISGSLE